MTAERRLSKLSAQVCASANAPARTCGPSIWSKTCMLGGNSLKGKTLLITGGSRGIGLAIARRAAADGANVVICAKTAEPHPTLPGTIHSAAAEVDKLGGHGLACVVDVRDEASIQAAVKQAIERFGFIDILINCASAIFPAPTEQIDLKRLNLMWEVTTRAPLLMAKYCVPYLKASAKAGRNPHIITCSPPVDFVNWPEPKNPNYIVCKMGMTVGSMALAEELRSVGVAANTLWPAGSIASSAINHIMGNDQEALDAFFIDNSRTPQIQSDAVHFILTSESRNFTGNMVIDEDLLIKAGISDLSKYSYALLGSTPAERLAQIIRV